MQYTRSLLIFSLVLIWVILCAHVYALNHYLYWIYPWFDVLMHILGGTWVGVTYGALIMHRHTQTSLSFMSIYMRTLLAVLIIGALWEGMEFFIDTFFNTRMFQLSPLDTLKDMISNGIGATIASIIIFITRRYA
ncbi:MAG: hypothetical protein LRY41_02935 [Candidatus Pacebacteria bacterium]|nr:hypothetical protein [Candidatus Paceibacterota bacterium]MCD8508016.1 hypothetical protein [Candidatus Paceibacterota bacterium]MCD8528252.1 hypothetical protein [Candidatus Paceibacterota bacterium]MCD8563796.1 hypothetical protein [Candidatus Paceibacterota bacterium]